MLKEIGVYPCLNDFTVPSIHCSKSAAENDSVTIIHLHCLLVLLRTAAQNGNWGQSVVRDRISTYGHRRIKHPLARLVQH